MSRSPSTLHWSETEVLAEERNYQGLDRLNTALIQHAVTRSATQRVTLKGKCPRSGPMCRHVQATPDCSLGFARSGRRGASPWRLPYITSIPLAVAQYDHQLFEAVASFCGHWTAGYRSSGFRAAGHPSAAHRSFEPGTASNHQRATERVNRGGTPPAKRPAWPPTRRTGVE